MRVYNYQKLGFYIFATLLIDVYGRLILFWIVIFDNLLILKQAVCEFIDIERQKEFYITMLYRRN